MPGKSASRPEQSRSPDWLGVEVVCDAGDWTAFGDVEAHAGAAGRALAAHARFRGAPPASACVALSDDENVRRLNALYRGQDKPTNVLSFPAPPASRSGAVRYLGDVVLAGETVIREARAQGLPLVHHLEHLVVHGLLHLLGYDHESEEEAAAMEALEVEILATRGIPDPYAEPAADLILSGGRPGTEP